MEKKDRSIGSQMKMRFGKAMAEKIGKFPSEERQSNPMVDSG